MVNGEEQIATAGTLSSTKIFIVEDDSLMNLTYNEVLKSKYDLAFYSSGQDFFAALEAGSIRPNLAIIDLKLKDGCFLELSEKKPRLLFPFIVISGYAQIKEIKLAYKYGAVDYLVKPFSMNALLVKIERILGGDWQERGIDINLDFKRNILLCENHEDIALTPKELRILSSLIEAPDFALSKQDLYYQVWGEYPIGLKSRYKTLDVHICNLKKKIVQVGYDLLGQDDGRYQLQKMKPSK